MNLLGKSNGNLARTKEEIEQMIDKAADAYGHFLNAVAEYNEGLKNFTPNK